MKKFYLFIINLSLILCLFFTGCNSFNQKNIANDLSVSLNNLSLSLENLDWPNEDKIDTLDNSTKYIRDSDEIIDDIQTKYDTDIDTTQIYKWINSLENKINILNSKKDEIDYYIKQMNTGNATLNESNLKTIKVYIDIVKDNSNYLSSYNGLITTQLDQATNIIDSQNNLNLINAYIIKAIETLQIRAAKLDTSILAINSICDIIKNNLKNKISQNTFIIDSTEHIEDNKKSDDIKDNETPEIDIDNNVEIDNNIEIKNNENNSQDEIKNDDEINNTQQEKDDETLADNEIEDDENEPKIADVFVDEKPITREIYKEKVV